MVEMKKLIDIADVFDSLHQTPEYVDTGVPMVRVTDVKPGDLELEGCQFVTDEVFEKFTASHVPQKGDIVISRVGSYGNFSYVADNLKFCLGQNTSIIVPKINSRYLYYYLRSPFARRQIESRVVGSTQKTLSLKNIKELEIPCPNRSIQDKIASFLETIDLKINYNKRINRNLQEQCDAIYRDCFITNIDVTWKAGSLSELITVKYGKDHKKLEDGTIPCYGSGGVIRYVEKALYDQESVLIPRKGSLNNVLYVNEPFWSVDTMFFTMMKMPNVAKFVYHFVKEKDLVAMNTGSAVPSMTSDVLNAMELLIPSSKSLEEFETKVRPLYDAMKKNEMESKKLSELRDSLLPKLMSGELDVSDIDI